MRKPPNAQNRPGGKYQREAFDLANDIRAISAPVAWVRWMACIYGDNSFVIRIQLISTAGSQTMFHFLLRFVACTFIKWNCI